MFFTKKIIQKRYYFFLGTCIGILGPCSLLLILHIKSIWIKKVKKINENKKQV